MLFSTEFIAPTNSKNKSADIESESAAAGETDFDAASDAKDNGEQFFSAFEAITIDEIASEKEWDLIDVDAIETESDINPSDELALISELIDADFYGATAGEYDGEALSNTVLTAEITGKMSAPALVASPAISQTAQQSTPSQAVTLTLVPPENDVNIPDGDLQTLIAGVNTDEGDVEAIDESLPSKRPLFDVRSNADSTTSAIQIKGENASSQAADDFAQRGLKNTESKTASSIATTAPPVQTAPVAGPQFGPIITSSPVITPQTAPTADFMAMVQNAAPSQQVAQILATVTPGQDKIQVRLDPPELGRVTVEFQFDGNRGVTAVVSAENADIGSQLRERSEFFFKSLRMAGFDSVDLSFDTQSNHAQNDSDAQNDKDSHAITIYESENQLIDLDVNAEISKQYLSTSEEPLNILL